MEKQKVILTLDCRGQYGITGKNGDVLHDVDPDLAKRMERSGHARIATLWDAAAVTSTETVTKSPITKSPNKK